MSDKLIYEPKTKPFDHQRRVLEETWDKEFFGIFFEQGTGKTKVVLDNMAALYEAGEIDCLFVVSPGCVLHNWTVSEIQRHVPDRVLTQTSTFAYHSSKASTKAHKAGEQRVLKHKGLSIVAQSYDGFRTKAGMAFAKKLLKTRKCFYVLDESARIKSPSAKRTISILASGPYAKYRRILTGTPVSNGPFDIYSQLKFLDKDFWKAHGLDNFTTFKKYFGVWKQQEMSGGRSFPMLLRYQNLEELHDILASASSRVTKDDVLDLPPKVYSKVHFDMSKKQAQIYADLATSYTAELEVGVTVDAELAIVRLLRLQQITSGYVATQRIVPHEDDPDYDIVINDVTDIDPGNNPRLKCLIDILTDIPHKVIIWARFTREVDMICEHLGKKAVRYDGLVSTEDRLKAIESFEQGMHEDAQYFVAKASAAGEGITLVQAKTCIYFSNTFKLNDREQSEDRAHRIGQSSVVNYLDIVAEGTIDDHLIDTLRGKKDIARIVTGDEFREWVQ